MNPYKRHRFTPAIISYAIWLYYRFNISHRDIEDLLAERGITVRCEAIRLWCIKFGTLYARRSRRKHRGYGDTFFIDEVFVKINGKQHYLWRAVNQGGEVVDVYLQAERDGAAAKRFLGPRTALSNLFNPGRHLVRAQHYCGLRISAFTDEFARDRRGYIQQVGVPLSLAISTIPLLRAVVIVKNIPVLLALIFSLHCVAQTTCFTDPHGTTLCSTPNGVIHGGTSSIGHSIYRDDRGNQLDYEVDQFGNASVQQHTGKSIDWSQSAPADHNELHNDSSSATSRSLAKPKSPGASLPNLPDRVNGGP